MSAKPLDEAVAVDIFGRMTVLYGHKWVSNLGSAIDGDGYLTVAAKIWSEELAGLDNGQLKLGFSRLKVSFPSWPPSVFEFLILCQGGTASEIPSLEQIATILGSVSAKGGTVAQRFKYPLALAIAQCQEVDMFNVRRMSLADIKRLIKPIYERFLNSGWADFEEFAHVEQKAIGVSS